jgi:hypothetical protein
MKRIAAVVVLAAALGFVVAGCGGSAKKGGSISLIFVTTARLSPEALTVSGTTTISDVKPGTSIGCKGGGPRVKVPAEAGVVNAGSGTASPSGHSHSEHLQLTRSPNGAVTVTCSRK